MYVNGNFCGHGIGNYLHEPTTIMHSKENNVINQGKMKIGHVFTIEPIFHLTKAKTHIL